MGALSAGLREEVPSAVSKRLAVLGRDVVTCVCRLEKQRWQLSSCTDRLRKGNWWQQKTAFPTCSAKPRVEQGWPSQGGAAHSV